MEKGILYGIGVGPGEADLITKKAMDLLGRLDVVIVNRQKKHQKQGLRYCKTLLEKGCGS
ncbi:MAG TPA: hypothetical protein DHN33_10715 [Eubacteriaceae bacterium]|nr:hypothetical protein [Eubacteriaceae bacterium]